MMKVCYEHHFANGIVSCEFDRQDTALNKLTLGTLEGHVYTLDVKNGFNGGEESIGILDSLPFQDKSTIW